MLKQGRMMMQFVSNPKSAYFRSRAFDSILNYIARNPSRCDLKEIHGRRMMHVSNIASVEEAVSLLRKMENTLS